MGGDNVIFWGPLAWTIIFGLTYATVLTLVMVPVMFYLVKRTKYALRDRKKRNNRFLYYFSDRLMHSVESTLTPTTA